MEVYLFEMVFAKEAAASPDPALASDFLDMLAQLDLEGLSGASTWYSLLLPSEAGRVALMGLLTRRGGCQLQRVQSCCSH